MGDELHGKRVECGSCENVFEVTPEVHVAVKDKFYPGEKKDDFLDKLSASSPDSAPKEVGFQPTSYQENVDVSMVGPATPRQIIAALAGAGLMLTVIVVFLLAGGEHGSLRDMATPKRFILAGFTALLGGWLLFYGTRRLGKMGLLLCLLFCGAVIAMPFVFPALPTKGKPLSDAEIRAQEEESDSKREAEMNESDYVRELGYAPVERALAKNPKEQVVAIYLRKAPDSVRKTVALYIAKMTGSSDNGITYERGDKGMDGLILFANQEKSLEEIAGLCEKFGHVNKTHPGLRVIDVTMEPWKLKDLDGDKVLDKKDIGYEGQNLKALQSISPDVQMRAVKRLAISEPKALRVDITRQMVSMLETADMEMKVELIKALKVWAVPDEKVDQEVLKAVRELHKSGKVDTTSMDFLISRKVDGAGGILLELWMKNPVAWSRMVIGLGENAQLLLVPQLDKMTAIQVIEAAGILGKVGGKDSIPMLEKAAEKHEGAAKKSLQAAIDEIGKRS